MQAHKLVGLSEDVARAPNPGSEVGSEELFGLLECNFWTAVANGRGRFHLHLGLETRFLFPKVGRNGKAGWNHR